MNLIHVAGKVENKIQRCARCNEPLKDMREQSELAQGEARIATYGGGAPYVEGATIEQHQPDLPHGTPWQTFFVGRLDHLAPYQKVCEAKTVEAPPAPEPPKPEPPPAVTVPATSEPKPEEKTATPPAKK